jgi:GMP synthase (glutamine-hydrolysing)
MRLHIIMHESFEAPGAIELWAREREHEISYTRLYNGDTLPAECDFDFLVIMGGPQSPKTTTDECLHFDAPRETVLIQKAVNEGKIVLGVCLGAQMLGDAMGGHFEHSPEREIGAFPLTLTEDGKQDPLFSEFPEKFVVGHWHGDMPGLTPDSKILAKSEGCPRQIVRYKPKVYGFQCHAELTPKDIEALIENSTEELEKYKDLPYVQSPEQLRSNDYSEMNRLLFSFLDKISS